MNNLPRQTLRQILAKHGKEVCVDARRCESLLNDLCGSYRREINVLVAAIEERVPLDLMAGNRTTPLELLLTRIEKRLEEQTALTSDAARWAVESWALALDLATESEIHSRRKIIESAAPPITKTEPIEPDKSAGNKITAPNRYSPTPWPKPPTIVPQSRTKPPIISPAQAPKPANNQPVNSSPAQTLPTTGSMNTGKSLGLFRGCLIIIFLLAIASILLFLGVPYAIEVMRETQREKSAEPPRFPSR
ncbi:MAG TPA: hypothetical protein VF692_15260 [Pyrinomonadaceae bacterium]|jgi:hypothetical protein